jgi:hypothetical protein
MTLRWMMVVSGALLAGAGDAAAGDKDVVRNLAGRVGPIIGSALACRDIARPRIQLIVDKFTAVITEASTNDAERSDLTQMLDRNVADGRGAVTSGWIDCALADRQLADLERAIARPAPILSTVVAPSFSAAATAVAATAPTTAVPVGPTVRGVTDREIRFGMSANLSGAAKENGRQFDTEKLVDVLENTRNLDLGLGTALNFGRAEHQASHKVWGTALDDNGKYQAVELE